MSTYNTHPRIAERTQKLQSRPQQYRQGYGVSNARIVNNLDNQTSTISSRALDIKFRNRSNIPASTKTTGIPVNSTMTLISSTDNSLKFNLSAPVFDAAFNSKPIKTVNMTRNLDGSVNIAIVYDNATGTGYKHFPENPAYDNFITPFDVDSPIYKGMHYWNNGSIIF